jgi:Kdo2-lipid IVA lauroyltransferase/acyltransferase
MARMLVGFIKATSRFTAWLPLRWARAWARHWGWMLAHVVRIRRAYVLDALAQGFPGMPHRERCALYAEVCHHQALNMMELLRFAGGREEEFSGLIEVRGEDIVKAALARGKGALILIAHFGNYDLMGMVASKLFGYPLTIITKRLKNVRLNELWWEMRRKAGVNEVPARKAYRPCVRALQQNGLVGFMLDQNRPPPLGIFVEFFGRPAATTPGLAFMSGANRGPGGAGVHAPDAGRPPRTGSPADPRAAAGPQGRDAVGAYRRLYEGHRGRSPAPSGPMAMAAQALEEPAEAGA